MHRMSTSPRLPENWPSIHSSVEASCERTRGHERVGGQSIHRRATKRPQGARARSAGAYGRRSGRRRVPASSCKSQQIRGNLRAKKIRGVSDRSRASPRAAAARALSPLCVFGARVRSPLYSIPHLSLAMMGLPVRSLRKGFGLTGTCAGER